MTIYDFTAPTEVPVFKNQLIQTVINGVNLDKSINGFRTLAVYGRELISKDITTADFKRIKAGNKMRSYVNRSSSSGNYNSRFISSKLSTRTITVEYQMKCNHWKEMTGAFERLNYYLDIEEAPIIFTDDIDFYYVGTLSNAKEIERNGLSIKSNFEFTISNPFKFGRTLEEFRFMKDGVFKKEILYPVKLEKIDIILKEQGEKFILKNISTGLRLILDKSFLEGDVITFDFEKFTVTGKNTQSLMKYLDLTSDFENFEIGNLDQLQTSFNADVSVKYREVRL